MTFTEQLMIGVLGKHLLRVDACLFVVPRTVYFRSFETDLLGVTRDGFPVEYEIKLTKKDFLADKCKKDKHDLLRKGQTPFKFFWYAAPKGVIPYDKLPSWAGLLEVEYSRFHTELPMNCRVSVVTQAPLQPRPRVVTPSERSRLLCSLSHRYLDTLCDTAIVTAGGPSHD